ncbi:MAG: hypothetical protein FVQ80_18040 [Planctomycetes bacterium]|nr:hypothetical protein [Planctomycetota bacterium]
MGSEEIKPEEGEEEEIEPYSQRHKVTLRIKEQWSDEVTTNLYTAVSRKEYFRQSGSYSYFYLNPDIAWEITDRIKWYTGFWSKLTFYDELDSEDNPKDFTSLLAKTNITFKPLDKLKIIPSFQSVFDLYQNQEKTQTTQTFGLSITSTIDNVRVGGRYKGILRSSMGEESTVSLRFNNEFGVNVNWDPNK